MQKLIILQGIPASGKSYFAKKFVLDNPNYVRVCRDDLRRMRGKYWLPTQEGMITAWEDRCVKEALKEYNVVVDATNLNPKVIEKWKTIAINFSAEIEYKMFDVDLDEAIKRDALRGEESIGEKVIRDFYVRYIEKKQLNEFKVEKIVQNFNTPLTAIFDIDGTIALMNGRSAYDYTRVDTDLPNWPVIDLCIDLMHIGYQIIFLSGREDSCKNETIDWIHKHRIFAKDPLHYIPLLYMRKTGDNRDDRIVKKEMFDNYIKDKYYIKFVIDDRNKVVKMWRDMGLTCLQVAEGNF